MPQKPTKLPEWASDPAADIIEPSEGKKDLGWVGGGEKPPHETFNWWQNLVFLWTQFLEQPHTRHDQLQDLIEASEAKRITTLSDPGSFGPQWLDQPRHVAGTELDSLSLDDAGLTNVASGGDLGSTTIDLRIVADGRFVSFISNTNQVTVLNARDLTEFAAVTTQNAPADEITAIATDGFSLAIAYDGLVELYDLTTSPPSLDTTWATNGVYTHDAAGSIESMVLTARSLIFVGNAAAGTDDTPAGDNIVALQPSGALFASSAAVPGNALTRPQIQYWNGLVIYATDNAGDNVAVWDVLNDDTVWTADLSALFAIDDVAINGRWAVIAGRNADVDDPFVRVYPVRGSNAGSLGDLIAEDVTFPSITAPDGYIMGVVADAEHVYVTARRTDSGAGTQMAAYRVGASPKHPTQDHDELRRVWQVDFDVATTSERPVAVAHDRNDLWILHEDSAGTDPEVIRRYSTGRGPGWWRVADRNQDAVANAAFPVGTEV